MKNQSLSSSVNQQKARWLKRVMYDPRVTPTQKCLAYAIFDHLNCVTLDCWPAQATLARLLGHKCSRTVQRATRGLSALGLITIKSHKFGKSEYRYAPVFPSEDNAVANDGQLRLDPRDTDVKESSLRIPITSSTSTAADVKATNLVPSRPSFSRHRRGALELKVAERLGPNGFDILAHLTVIDDDAVTRLCRACADGVLGERDLAAARLVVERA